MKTAYCLFLFLFSYVSVLPQSILDYKGVTDKPPEIAILRLTGDTSGTLPHMTVLPDTAALYKSVMGNIHHSFVGEFLETYFIAQTYLINIGELKTLQPAYLALTSNQGGFAKFGFALIQGGQIIEKPHTPYVDITVRQATSPLNRLMSFTQLYPHEMGHVLLHMLSSEDTIYNNTKNIGIHYFSLVTDYSTAFNEGFAEHIENVSRLFEDNDQIKSGILTDVEMIGRSSERYIAGFRRDFVYPVRLGYYKASMLEWYQRFEDYKRYEQAMSGDIRYKNATLPLSNIEDRLTYRNSGVALNRDELRNLVQLHATEGVINSFFTHLTTSDLSRHYLDTSFYLTFLADGRDSSGTPQEWFRPWQNQFIKYFKVFHDHVVLNNSEKSQLADFIDGYIKEFPSEEEGVKRVYKEVFHTEYSNAVPPPLWILVKDHHHRLLVLDPFGSLTVPIYTFDLNAAEKSDLQTIEGISASEAQKIVNYRAAHGFFTDLQQLKQIPDLPTECADKVISSALDIPYFEKKLVDFAPKLSLATLASGPIKYVFGRASIYFVVIFGFVYFLFLRHRSSSVKHTAGVLIKYMLLWLLFILTGMVAVLFLHPAYLYVVLLALLLALISTIVYRKNKSALFGTITFIGLMGLVVLASVI